MKHSKFTRATALIAAFAMCFGTTSPVFADKDKKNGDGETSTPIKHLVVIFGENISFDHYFGIYPNAENPASEPEFEALPGTPTVNGFSTALLNRNPNALNTANGTGATNPFRLDRSQALTNSQSHAYTAEQNALHMGLLDVYPVSTGKAGAPPNAPPAQVSTKGLNMGYYDGNTVTAMWNYAQHFALNDNSFGTTFGPSTPGVINLVSGQTNGIAKNVPSTATGNEVSGGDGDLTLIGDIDPAGDVCSSSTQVQMSSRNIGDMLSSAGVTWGSFMGGFDLTIKNPNGSTGCNRSTVSPVISAFQGTATAVTDYVPHHSFLQYYASTANPSHTRPASISEVGNAGPANHEYDINDFFAAVNAGHFPAVSFLKAQSFQDAHPGNSDPLDEQAFVVSVINFLQNTPDWKETAVVLMYDDSDGWYDHQMGPIVNQSSTTADTLTGLNSCGNGTNSALPGADVTPGGNNPLNAHAQGRCGYAIRQPLLVISPYARENFVDHTLTDQTSVLRFIEDNWLGGERIGAGSFDNIAGTIENMFDFTNRRDGSDGKLFLDTATGLRSKH